MAGLSTSKHLLLFTRRHEAICGYCSMQYVARAEVALTHITHALCIYTHTEHTYIVLARTQLWDRWLVVQAVQVQVRKGSESGRQQLCSAAAACLQHMCQHTDARPAVQAAGAIPLLACLCDINQWSVDVVRYASAALASIAVGPDVKVSSCCY